MFTIDLNLIREAYNQLEEKVVQLQDRVELELNNECNDNEELFEKLEDLATALSDMEYALVDFESAISEAEETDESLSA